MDGITTLGTIAALLVLDFIDVVLVIDLVLMKGQEEEVSNFAMIVVMIQVLLPNEI
jgi:hypothetical protein